MDEADEIIHQSTRLRIMSVLSALPRGEKIQFPHLRSLINATQGNLGAHLATLEQAGYIRIEKDFEAKKPRTRVSLTVGGRHAFKAHIAYLREVVRGLDDNEGA
ncbi:MAG: transcriptional regulator [Steroidobacteraceae bacterium]